MFTTVIGEHAIRLDFPLPEDLAAWTPTCRSGNSFPFDLDTFYYGYYHPLHLGCSSKVWLEVSGWISSFFLCRWWGLGLCTVWIIFFLISSVLCIIICNRFCFLLLLFFIFGHPNLFTFDVSDYYCSCSFLKSVLCMCICQNFCLCASTYVHVCHVSNLLPYCPSILFKLYLCEP